MPSPLSPYLGFGSLAGAIALAREQGRGVYVLALTSNPEGPQFQHAMTAAGRSVGQTVVDEAAALNAGSGLGHVGVVVGATIGRTGVDFSALNGSILAPGPRRPGCRCGRPRRRLRSRTATGAAGDEPRGAERRT